MKRKDNYIFEAMEKYDLQNTYTKEILEPQQLYFTSIDTNTMTEYMDISQYHQELINLIDNITDIHNHEPRNEINDSLNEHVSSLKKVSKLLANLTPIVPSSLRYKLNIANEVDYICENTKLDAHRAENLASLCYEAYRKDDTGTSLSSITANIVTIINSGDIEIDLNTLSKSDILEAYYMCENQDIEEAISLLDIKNKEQDLDIMNMAKKGINERMKKAEDLNRNKNDEKSIEIDRAKNSKDIER